MDVINILTDLVQRGASDIFVVAGRPLAYKLNNRITDLSAEPMMPAETKEFISSIYKLSNDRSMERLLEHGDDDFSFSMRGVSRFRASAYKQRGSLAAVIRVVAFTLPDPSKLGIPESVLEFADNTKGLVLVTGPSGSGKSTTLACMIDRINNSRCDHIITLEDPIEFTHSHHKSIVSQREITLDTDGYVVALRAALRQSPDVILIGELRDTETINIAMTAAETGHLVISTLHTIGAANTVDRIVDAFPSERQGQIRMQLSMVLQAVVSQQLLPSAGGKIVPAFEIMKCNTALRNMIREGKTHQIDAAIFSGAAEGMITMDSYLADMCRKGKITENTAIAYAINPASVKKNLG